MTDERGIDDTQPVEPIPPAEPDWGDDAQLPVGDAEYAALHADDDPDE